MAKLARTADIFNDFVDFVVIPFLEIEEITDAVIVERKMDLFIRIWNLIRYHEYFRYHLGNILNSSGRIGLLDPMIAYKSPLFGAGRHERYIG